MFQKIKNIIEATSQSACSDQFKLSNCFFFKFNYQYIKYINLYTLKESFNEPNLKIYNLLIWHFCCYCYSCQWWNKINWRPFCILQSWRYYHLNFVEVRSRMYRKSKLKTENFNGLFKNYTHMKHYLKTGTVYITNNPWNIKKVGA